MSLKVGEVAWRILGGPHKGRLCWLNKAELERKFGGGSIKVQLCAENVPTYGLWGGESVTVKAKYLKEVHTVAVWSDQLEPKVKTMTEDETLIQNLKTAMKYLDSGVTDEVIVYTVREDQKETFYVLKRAVVGYEK